MNRFVLGMSRLGWVPVFAADEQGRVLHTEPVCTVPELYHAWFLEWLKAQPCVQEFHPLLEPPAEERT